MKFTLATLAVLAATAMAAPAPDAEPEPWCFYPGQPCWKKAKREALPEPKAEPVAEAKASPWCFYPGQPCWKKAKRDADADAEAKPWCFYPGQPCWKVKRAAEAFSDALQISGNEARSADADAEADLSNLAGGAAFKAKREIHELANVISLATRDDSGEYYRSLNLERAFPADSDPKAKRDAEPWCFYPGQPCWKNKRNASPEAKAKAEAAEQKDKRWCFYPGQPCWKAKRAADAVVEALGDDEEAEAPQTPNYGPPTPWGFFPGQSQWNHAKRDDKQVDKRWCFYPGQPCWKAKRDIDAIRTAARSITEA
ncbi:hypothetical protein NW754_000535 [Fusarium falciforme]|uniref:Hypothetical protein n=1 Tax=Fusarium falciforme TaxID=195108 RepID=UPI002301EE49|nr:Hypothetical protein NCS54_00211000 [Fusarium falciforme]KAJ4149099.1 hypothetical protein NW754_000535 [Fusarium falciforme]KAJ4199497.1 hypothetical protein NW767_008305 [Fusarium falciforme]KAJ4255780.1 hypothetical protein NW757_004399 [Fusarium falciforme]WAO84881.1 Hypothetical protein NCS54_00211000 [Fusarium falciforme]